MTRSSIGALLGRLIGAAALTAISTAALAQTIYFSGPGGVTEERYRKLVIPAFEKKYNVKVQYIASQTTEILAKLEAQRGKQELDVVSLADGTMAQADERGFCAPLQDNPVYSELIPQARLTKNSIGVYTTHSVIAINTKIFAQKGLPEPKSWKDLGDPKYKGEMALLSVGSSITGVHGLVMVSRAVGGDEKNTDAGFKYFKENIRPNLVTVVQSAAKMSEMLQTGEVAIGVTIASRASALTASGAPIKSIIPAEGAPVAVTAVCPIAGSDVPDLAQKLVQFLVSVEAQQGFEIGEEPTNKNAKSASGGSLNLTALDWATINANRDAWVDRWNREIER